MLRSAECGILSKRKAENCTINKYYPEQQNFPDILCSFWQILPNKPFIFMFTYPANNLF